MQQQQGWTGAAVADPQLAWPDVDCLTQSRKTRSFGSLIDHVSRDIDRLKQVYSSFPRIAPTYDTIRCGSVSHVGGTDDRNECCTLERVPVNRTRQGR